MKKILIICHTFSSGGGSEKVLDTLLGELSKWYKIDIIERLEDNTKMYPLPKNVKKLKSMSMSDNKNIEEKRNVFFGKLWRKLLAIITLLYPAFVYKQYIKKIYDFEISFNYLYPSLLIAHSKNKISKKIMWMHGSIENLDYKKYKDLSIVKYYLYYKMQKKAFEIADKIIAISENTKNSIGVVYKDMIKKTNIIYNGYDFNDIGKKAEEKIHIKNNNVFRTVSVGRLDKNKNVALQIEAVKHLLDNNIMTVELYVVGSGEEEEILKQKSGKYLDKSIFFTGYLQNPYPILKSSNVLLMTSYCEGFPTVIVEALSLGVPVISTDVGGSKELVRDGENGFIIDRNIEAVCDAIKKISSMNISKNEIQDTVKSYTKEAWCLNVKKMLEESNANS